MINPIFNFQKQILIPLQIFKKSQYNLRVNDPNDERRNFLNINEKISTLAIRNSQNMDYENYGGTNNFLLKNSIFKKIPLN